MRARALNNPWVYAAQAGYLRPLCGSDFNHLPSTDPAPNGIPRLAAPLYCEHAIPIRTVMFALIDEHLTARGLRS